MRVSKRTTAGRRTARLILWISRVYSSTTSTLPANTNVRARFQLITRSGSNEVLSNRTGSMCAAIPPRSCLWWPDYHVFINSRYIDITVYHHTPGRWEMLLPPSHGYSSRSLFPFLIDSQTFLPQTANFIDPGGCKER